MSIDLKLEVVVIPVADVDRSKRFYGGLGWRLDADIEFAGGVRVVQFTPPGSPCSIHFGKGVTSAAPGSSQGSYLVVSDVVTARAELAALGADVSEVFHRTPQDPHAPGPHPDRSSYSSFASFKDPDGNSWLLQEITTRFAGRVDSGVTQFNSESDLVAALRRAADAHGEHEKRTGQHDVNWADWYATYLVKEQNGETLPT